MVSQHGSRVKRRAARAARLLRKSAFIPMSAIAERSGILRIPHLTVNGIGLNVEVAGAGPPLLLLHGFTGSTATWASHLPELAGCATTIAVDLIGHGGSDAPADPARYTMSHCIADLLAV